MANADPAPFSERELAPFLYAAVAKERSGMEITVLSALARRGLDPWKEARRLAALPRPDAAAELDALMASLRLRTPSAAANNLVSLLPANRRAPSSAAMTALPKVLPLPKVWLIAALAAGVLGLLVFAPGQQPVGRVVPASWFTDAAPVKPVAPIPAHALDGTHPSLPVTAPPSDGDDDAGSPASPA